ncbi:hypothetical protein Pfo_007154 [Paulownia fortunei]|nr:hypothetical protein Pfo_007154 [Paulownia fortunei]
MHIEKNICDALVDTLLSIDGKSKDTVKARLDMQDMGIRSELHLKKIGDRVSKPYASYTFTLEERREFYRFLKSVKFPNGYATNISKNVNVNNGKLYDLKTHDCHVLLQILLPIAIRKFLPNDMCGTIVELCNFFKKLTSRTLHVANLKKMKEDIVFILCKMEIIFPLEFFDIMVHLTIHLSRETILAGPYVRNLARLEGSIAKGYVVNEALTFSSLYMSQIETKFTKPDHNKDATKPILFTLIVFNQQIRVMGSQRNHKLPLALYKKAHYKHLQILSLKNPSSCILQCGEEQFPQNQKNQEAIDELYSLALGPDVEVRLYDACIINGVRYHTLSRDTHWTTQNSGVSIPSSDKGDNLDLFGVLKDVVLIFYTFGYKKSVVQEFGLTCINTSKTWYENDPFILATQARQVYYLDDIKHRGRWKVVQKVHHREIYEVTEKKDKNNVEHEFESSSNNEPNLEISSDEISLSVHEDLEISDFCKLDIQPQHIELLDTQTSFSENMHDFINDEGEDT